MGDQGECFLPAECESSPRCDVLESLCSNIKKEYYNNVTHAIVTMPGSSCNTFRCRAGTCSDSIPATDGGDCRPASPAGTVGGFYGDVNGVCRPCDINGYVRKATVDGKDTYTCDPATAATMDQMYACLEDANNDAEFAKCVGESGESI
jgi:hypothetical protein